MHSVCRESNCRAAAGAHACCSSLMEPLLVPRMPRRTAQDGMLCRGPFNFPAESSNSHSNDSKRTDLAYEEYYDRDGGFHGLTDLDGGSNTANAGASPVRCARSHRPILAILDAS